MSNNILVTGSNGQIGQELQALVANYKYINNNNQFFFTNKDTLDITDEKRVEEYIDKNSINTIVNCASYSNLNDAKENSELAYRVNAEAVKNLSELSKIKQIKLIHISTAYVYDEDKNTPLNEDDNLNPKSLYAKSKLKGEEAILDVNPEAAIIIRTAWLYSSYKEGFIASVVKQGREKESLDVICDQIGTPTYARDLARVIVTILENNRSQSKDVEIYNYSNEGNCSWYDFAEAIFDISNIECSINPILSKDDSSNEKQPYYSVLNKAKIKERQKVKIPYWRDSLKSCLSLLNIKDTKKYKIGIIGSGFIANGLAKLLIQSSEYTLSKVLTRTNINNRDDFSQSQVLTNSLDDLIETCDLIVECSGDAIYATETIDVILKHNIPVVTMNSEFHVTTGSYFTDKGLVTEAEGDQPGVEAILHEEAVAMGFKPLAYVNIKGFLNENPDKDEMKYWGDKSNLSLEMVTSFTDGTKVQIEQVLIANGLGAGIIQEGLVKLEDDDMLSGGTVLANKAKELGYPVSDYVLSAKLPAGVFLIVEHNEEQVDSLKYYKLGDGPYYVLERTYHLCHLEIIKTIKRVLDGGGVLLNNSKNPQFSVAAVAKHDLKVGETIEKAIGSFDVRGTAVEIKSHIRHVPIGLLANAKIKNEIKEGQIVKFDDIEIPDTLALNIWYKIIKDL